MWPILKTAFSANFLNFNYCKTNFYQLVIKSLKSLVMKHIINITEKILKNYQLNEISTLPWGMSEGLLKSSSWPVQIQ